MDVDSTLNVGGMPISDRGDGPAQIVIEKNLKAQAQRRADATKEELDKIRDRVDKTMAAFELNEQLLEDNKAAFFVPDLIELEKIISDAIQKRRYQQQVMIFIVGYEDVSEQRLKTLSQINDFFTLYINSIDEKELEPKLEVDLDDVSTRVQEAMDTAAKATEKLTEIKEEMSSYVDKLQGGKLASKSKKKLEKALVQAKEDIMNLTEKLMGAQSEIEDKEDQMTKLYKQLDVKNIEAMKYKNLAEKARHNTGQFADELKVHLEERDIVIDDLNRVVADQELTIKQMESVRDSNTLKLRSAVKENQETISKLEGKLQSLQVLLEDTKTNLFKQHKSDLEEERQSHLQEIELLKVEYQEKIDALEESSQIKQWTSDSEDESEVNSLGRKSNLESRKSNRSALSETSPEDNESRNYGKLSRQASTIKKSAASNRQTSAVTTKSSVQPTPTPGDTMSKSIPDPAKVMARPKDEMDSKSNMSTPKRATRGKSNLEPVHEIPFEGKIPIEDEEQWEQVPKEQMPSAFKQYRKEALFIVKGLQTEIQKAKEENHQQVSKLKETVKEKEEKWDGEKKTLLRQVGTIEKLRQEAEKEADKAVAQLEEFVKDQEKVAQLAEEQERKALKKLTPEQRAKYLGDFQPKIPSIEEISGENTGSGHTEGKRPEPDKGREEEKKKEEVVLPKLIKKPEEETTEKPKENGIDTEQQTTPVPTVARSLQTSRQELQQDSKIQGFKKNLKAAGEIKSIVVKVPVPVIQSEDDSDLQSLFEGKDQAIQAVLNEKMTIQPKLSSRPTVAIATQTDPFPYVTPVIRTEFLDSDSTSIRQAFRNSRHYSTTSSESPLSLRGDSTLHSGVSGEEGDIEDEGESEEPNAQEPSGTLSDNDEPMKSPISTQSENSLVAKLEKELMEHGDMSDDDINTPGFDKDRPLSASSQRSLVEKYKAQLEQRKAEIVERRSRATSMHGSLLSAASSGKSEAFLPDIPFPEDGQPPKPLSAVSSYHRDPSSGLYYSRAPSVSNESGVSMHEEEIEEELVLLPVAPTFSSIGCLADVETEDVALSPIALSTSSKDSKDSKESDGSKKSLSYIADHPIVQDYLKTYGIVNDFKEALSRMLADRELMSASAQLEDIKQLEFDKEKNVRYQVAEMTLNVEAFMKEASDVFNTLLSNDFEAPLSDFVSRTNTSKTRQGVDNLDRELYGLTPGLGGIDPQYPATGADPPTVKQLQDKYDNLQQDLLQQRKDYEERLNQNAVLMMEMQDTIQELQREMTVLGASPSKLPSSFSRASSATESVTDPSIIFSRLDADRNQKALKRGLNAQKVSSEQYNEAVKIMDQYTLLPAKRLVHLVKKYTHHAHMKAIEENVRHSSSLDDEVFHILEKMESLQNMRAQRWGEEMDEMAAERLRLSQKLLEALSRIEQESGIFMIKPILSYEGRSQFLQYHRKNSGIYRPNRTPLRPVAVPLTREGTPPDLVPAPTPAASLPEKAAARPTTHEEPRIVQVEVPISDKSEAFPVQGSSVNLIGTPPGNMWAMSSSVVSNRSSDGPASLKNSLINTPRILELDINRMLIGQNAVSALTKPLQSNDLLVNASNNSVRSYMTIARPSAQPNLKPNRPSSVGNENDRSRTPNNTPFISGKPASAGSPQRRSSSGFSSIHARAKSEGAIAITPGQRLSPPLNLIQPLPPIKVPFSGERGNGDASKNQSRVGSAGAVSVINEETASQGRVSSVAIPDLSKDSVHHPLPPHTPPGSSLHQSPTPPRLPSAASSVGGGILTKLPHRSNSRSTVHSAALDKDSEL